MFLLHIISVMSQNYKQGNIMKKISLTLISLVLSFNLSADNTVGYVKISDLKAFSNYISIYLKDGQTQNCATSSNTRFQSDTAQPHITSFLLTAFTSGKGVRFQYTCSGTTAIVTGVRLQEGS